MKKKIRIINTIFYTYARGEHGDLCDECLRVITGRKLTHEQARKQLEQAGCEFVDVDRVESHILGN